MFWENRAIVRERKDWTLTSNGKLKETRATVLEDRKVTVTEIAWKLTVTQGTAYFVVYDGLGFLKVCTSWVPGELTENLNTVTQASNPVSETLSQQRIALVISSYGIRPRFIITNLRANDRACSANTAFTVSNKSHHSHQLETLSYWWFGIPGARSVNIVYECRVDIWSP
jgi:hypothetical protein